MIKYNILVIVFTMLITIPFTSFSQTQTEKVIKGKVINAITKEKLAGINISAGQFSSAITDENGMFSIKVVDDRVTLVASAPEFTTKEVPLKGRNNLIIELYSSDFYSYYGDVVMPLGEKSRTSIVNSIVTMGNTNNNSEETIGGMFDGEVSGLRSIKRSGTPGAGSNMFLRGYSSLNGSTQPLIVVDGMILETTNFSSSLSNGHQYDPLTDIDPKDIANITIIKDACSIYGSKAANGVVLIETNRSKDITTKIDFQVQQGLNIKPDYLSMMNASEYKS